MVNIERFSSTIRGMNWNNVLHKSNAQAAYTMSPWLSDVANLIINKI